MNTAQKIEAILFMDGGPVTKKDLAKILDFSIEEIESGISNLRDNLDGHGLILIEKDDTIVLGTHKDLSDVIEKMRKAELEKELTKASLETISIILYRDGATRNDIDYIRGVNSSFILRTLMIRGLIERDLNPNDKRQYVYKPTIDLLAYLGVSNIEEIPRFQEINAIITGRIKEAENGEE